MLCAIMNPKTAASSGYDIFMGDFQTRLMEDFDVITSNAEDFAGLFHMQRLYHLSKKGRNYLSGEFQTRRIMPDYSPMLEDLSEIKSTLLENKVDVIEMVSAAAARRVRGG